MSAAVISTLIFASPGASVFSEREQGERPVTSQMTAVSARGQGYGSTQSDASRSEKAGASAFSGSRTDSVERDVAGSVTLVAPGQSVPDPSADYWHALAVKRLKLIGKRERRIVALLVRIHKLRASHKTGTPRHQSAAVRSSASPASIICRVFGAHCSEAIHVAQCESTMNVYARNGDYEGLFQFGSFARAHYGFAWDALTQARAAYRYWRDAGWSPWQCAP